MSRDIADPTVSAHVKKLREQSSPTKTDKHHALWERYINGLCGYFGRERAFLVGSTAEKSKLRWSKDGGDTDILFISGNVEIPVGCLEFRTETPCFVWIRGESLQSAINVDLVDGTHLPAGLLQVLCPEAFTILRGLHTVMTTTFDGPPGTGPGITTTGVGSNVGLARTEYRRLQLSKETKSYIDRQTKLHGGSSEATYCRTTTTEQKLATGKGKMMWNILQLAAKSYPGYDSNQWHKEFAYTMHIRDRELSSVVESTNESKYANGLDTTSFEVTYLQKISIDFVPAFRIDGRLGCMDDWRNRRQHWPCPDDVQEIYDCELYVVSKVAPVNGNPSKDFCLSFNQAELKLSACMSPVQRDVFLILKSYLKGTIENNYSDKLTTFHLKTALYWVSETNGPEIWREDNIIEAAKIVLKYIRDSLMTKYMQHYFLPSNLFAGLDAHFNILIEAIDCILVDPIACIQAFFNLDDDEPVTLSLDEKQMQYLVRLYNDGGKQPIGDILEDVFNDFQRGFDARPKDAIGRSPISDAIVHVGQLYLEDVRKGNAPVTTEVYPWNEPAHLAQNASDISNDLLSLIGKAVQQRNEADARVSGSAAEGGDGSGYSDIAHVLKAALGLDVIDYAVMCCQVS